MRKVLISVGLFLLAVCMAQGQGVPVNGEVLKSSAGQAATVRVCTKDAIGTPCTILANIYSDDALTIPKANPFPTDALGNYGYFVAPGTYKEQITAARSATRTRTISVAGSAGIADSSVVHKTGDETVAGTKTFSDAVVAGEMVLDGNSAISVRKYGAKGDGTTDDTAAIQAAIDAALARPTGGEVVFPFGLYRTTSQLNVGLNVYDDYDFIVNRTAPLSDAALTAHSIAANYAANAGKPPVVIRFEGGAALYPTFTPSVPTPVLAYNLRYASAGAIINPRILGMGAVLGGARVTPTVKATNNLIGIFALAGAKVIQNPYTSAVQWGVVTVGGFWTSITDSYCDWGAGSCLSLALANAITVKNTVAQYAGRGTVFDGDGGIVSGIHTQQVGEELVVLAADTTTFENAYFEDVDSSDGTGKYMVTLGSSQGASQLTSVVFKNIRIGHTRPGKKAFRIWSSKNLQFIASRTFGRGVDVDNVSYGVIQACDSGDFDNTTTFPTDRWIRPANALGGNVTTTQITNSGELYNNANLYVKSATAATGYALIVPGGATTTARYELWDTSAARIGYIGDDNANFKITANKGQIKLTSANGITFDGKAILNNPLKLSSVAAYTCNSSARGEFNFISGGAGVKDIVQVCAKDAADNYAWRTIY